MISKEMFTSEMNELIFSLSTKNLLTKYTKHYVIVEKVTDLTNFLRKTCKYVSIKRLHTKRSITKTIIFIKIKMAIATSSIYSLLV